MKRRNFLKNTIPVAVLPSFLQGKTVSAYGPSSILSRLASSFVETDHVLVLVQLNGGNDGLNTVIPLDQYSALSNARSNILIPDTKVLKLNGTQATGLHPAMTHLRDLYNDGKLNIVQSVGYPNQNYSHFRSTDIWLTAADSDKVLNSGWAGRYLSEEYPNFPAGFPNAQMPDPLAIQIGSVVSPGFQGLATNMAMAITDPVNFYNLVSGTTDSVPNTWAGDELTYIRSVASQTQQYATVIKAAAAKANNKSSLWPTAGQNKLADQMKIVSRLVAGGLKTRIYMVSLGGFDTHSLQVDQTGGTDKGEHANLLKTVSEAIYAFMDDCKQLGIADRVVGMTFSEFGRRVRSNFSLGTDHGAAAPVFVFGNPVKGGITGNNPTIRSSTTAEDNIAMQYDFRRLYSTMIQDWFCLTPQDTDAVMLKHFDTLPLVNSTCTTTPIARDVQRSAGDFRLKIFPVPVHHQCTVEWESIGGHFHLELLDAQGRLVRVLHDGEIQPGPFSVNWNRDTLSAGMYYIAAQQGLQFHTKSIIVAE